MTKQKKIEASKLKKHTGYWMRLVSNIVSHSFARKLETSGVTVAEWVVMREMYGGDDITSPGAVSALTGLTRGAVSKLIDRLLDKGFVHRDEAIEDRRYQDIKLTTKAIELVPKLVVLANKNDEEFFSALTNAEHNQLLDLLKKLAEYHKIKTVPMK